MLYKILISMFFSLSLLSDSNYHLNLYDTVLKASNRGEFDIHKNNEFTNATLVGRKKFLNDNKKSLVDVNDYDGFTELRILTDSFYSRQHSSVTLKISPVKKDFALSEKNILFSDGSDGEYLKVYIKENGQLMAEIGYFVKVMESAHQEVFNLETKLSEGEIRPTKIISTKRRIQELKTKIVKEKLPKTVNISKKTTFTIFEESVYSWLKDSTYLTVSWDSKERYFYVFVNGFLKKKSRIPKGVNLTRISEKLVFFEEKSNLQLKVTDIFIKDEAFSHTFFIEDL